MEKLPESNSPKEDKLSRKKELLFWLQEGTELIILTILCSRNIGQTLCTTPPLTETIATGPELSYLNSSEEML